jgi:hypothetical protein
LIAGETEPDETNAVCPQIIKGPTDLPAKSTNGGHTLEGVRGDPIDDKRIGELGIGTDGSEKRFSIPELAKTI